MISYYTAVLFLCWMTLAILCILMRENDRIPNASKGWFYLSYGLIAAASLAEWGGVALNGNEAFPPWLLVTIKCADYILTPMSGVAFIAQMQLHNVYIKILTGIVTANAIIQIVCCFNGGMVSVNDQNQYTHGPLYPIYVIMYLSVIVLVIVQFTQYGRSFRKQNRTSLYAIMLFVFAAIGIQEVLGSDFRTSYLGMTIGATLLLIHLTEFSQQEQDEIIAVQEVQIITDPLTCLLNRAAYSNALRQLDVAGRLPEDFVAFSIDINGLKETNDRLGHNAGDELICGAAQCIDLVFGDKGECYRTGGDEFVVLARMRPEGAQASMDRLAWETSCWSGEKVHKLSLSAGYAFAADHIGLPAEKLVSEADDRMYAAKADYYRQTDHDRRRISRYDAHRQPPIATDQQ